MSDLLSVDDALQNILARIEPLPTEIVSINDGLGRVLAEDVVSDTNVPPFANSSMDGYAVRAKDVIQVPVNLRLVMDIPAGASPQGMIGTLEAARIMTGAPLPDGADTIVPVESTDSQFVAGEDSTLPESVTIRKGSKTGDYVRPIGEDFRVGQTVLAAGTVLRPQEIGILAALGKGQLPVIRQPRVAILSSGDELIGVDEPLTAGKIRDVNGYTLTGLVKDLVGIPLRLPIARDTLDDLRQLFRSTLEQQPDVIISSAGVSVGSFDFVRTVLAELGQVNFWRINLRPGKPLAFGELQGIPFFGLPGNPVSAMVTFDVLVRPALLKMAGKPDDAQLVTVVTGEPIRSDGRRSFLRVKLARESGKLVAYTTGTQSSGALMSMVLADGLLIVPEDVYDVPAGTELPVRLFRKID
jgi:molybdopterin molybdotransferase